MCGMKRKTPLCFFMIETKQKKHSDAAPRLERLHGLGSTQVRSYRLSNPETGTGSAYGFRDWSGEGRCWRIACKLSV
jgi:hypothetical protein